jgi:hypothetical protein
MFPTASHYNDKSMKSRSWRWVNGIVGEKLPLWQQPAAILQGGLPDGRPLIPAGVVLRRHKNEPRAPLRGTMLRRAAAHFKNAKDCQISRQHADADRGGYGNAENQRHEKRNHDQSPLLNCDNQMPHAQLSSTASSIYLR